MKNIDTEKPYFILKIEEIRNTNLDSQEIFLTLGNKIERLLLRISNFPNFIYYQLPERYGPWNEEKCEDIINKVNEKAEVTEVFFADNNWEYHYRDYYYYYPPRRHHLLMLLSTEVFALDKYVKALDNYFITRYEKEMKKNGKREAKQELGLAIHINNFTIVQKLTAKACFNPGHWIKIGKSSLSEDADFWSHLPVFEAKWKRISRITNVPMSEFPNLKVACLDFEVYGSRKGKFPDPWKTLDEIYLASLVVAHYGVSQNKSGYLLVDQGPHNVQIKNNKNDEEPANHIRVGNEIELLRALERLILEQDIDVLITYNGNSFDFPYWMSRLDREGEDLGKFGRIHPKKPFFKLIDWSSSAVKSREQQVLNIPGVICADLYSIIRRDYFYPIYTLAYVSEQVLGRSDMKDHLEATDQFRIYESGTFEEWKRLLHYSLRDSHAPLDILEKKSIISNLFAMASIIGINVDDIYTRGQQYRLENRVFQELVRRKIVLDKQAIRKEEKYKGAIVQDPKIGLYTMVACIDFASLYPSILIAYNISHDTFVGTNLQEPPERLTWDDLYHIDVNIDKENEIKEKKPRIHYFVKQHVKMGVLPSLIKDFLDARKAKKKEMKSEKDPLIRETLDAEQNALKVIANSCYGMLGADGGKLALPQGAESITAMGRFWITFVIDCLLGKHGPIQGIREDDEINVIYGDSVVRDTPILVRRDGVVEIKTIETLGKNWKPYELFKPWAEGDKEQSESDYEVWTDNGWVKIKRAIRHYTDKSIYGVLTDKGYVKVTEDHSLLKLNSEELTPNEAKVGQELLHSFPFESDEEIVMKTNRTTYYATNQLDASRIYYDLRQKGYNVGVEDVYDDGVVITVDCKIRSDKIKKIRKVGKCEDYVYDLETENGHFQAGVGEMIVHNTDSVFLTIKRWQSMSEAKYYDEIQREITTICKAISDKINMPPIEIVPDHTYLDYLLLQKKQDFKNEIVEDKRKGGYRLNQSHKGNASVRREYPPVIKSIYRPMCESAVSRIDWDDIQPPLAERKKLTEEIFWCQSQEELISIESRRSKLYKVHDQGARILSKGERKYGLKVILIDDNNLFEQTKKAYVLDESRWELDQGKINSSYQMRCCDEWHFQFACPSCKRNKETPSGELQVLRAKSLTGVCGMLSRSYSLDDFKKITQASREPGEYKKESQPIRRFMEREAREGRPVKVGERFEFWRVRPPPNQTGKVYAGDLMRKKLEEGEKLDIDYYLSLMAMPIEKLFQSAYGDGNFFKREMGRLTLKKRVLEQLLHSGGTVQKVGKKNRIIVRVD